MNEHAIDSTEETRWSAAVDQAVTDKAVATYLSMPRLLRQLPVGMREQVREEMEAFGPVPPQSYYCIAYVLREDLPVGTWRTWQRPDRPDVFWVIVVVDQADYAAFIKRVRDLLAKQRNMSFFN